MSPRPNAALSLLVGLVATAGCAAANPSPEATAAKPPAAAQAERPAPSADGATTSTEGSGDEAFRHFAESFLDGYLRLYPVSATEWGDHRFDGTWPDMTEAGTRARRDFARRTREALAAMDPRTLSIEARIDRETLDHAMAYELFKLEELRVEDRDPMMYARWLGDGIDPLVTRRFAPPSVRAQSLLGRLRGLPTTLRAATARLADPTRVHTETAAAQVEGLSRFVRGGFPELCKEAPEAAAALGPAASEAARALDDFAAHLRRVLLPNATRSERLGRDAFAKKLAFELDASVDPDALVKDARKRLDATHEEMVQTAELVWPTVTKLPLPPRGDRAAKLAFVRKTLGLLAEDRPTDTTIVAEAERLLADATAFVRANDLVRVPDEPCRVIEMPEYKRGVSIAYCDSSGPLEKVQETFYAIAPTPADWPAARKLSFYMEYNRSMLADLTVHEAMPGHFLQAMHANRFPSPLRAVFSSGPFVEGWAVYAEGVMARHGYGGPKVALQRQKMILRLCANAILDHGLHVANMTEADALALMTKDAMQEEGEAVGKWKRARLSSGQLSTYFYGFREMEALRAEAEGTEGFSERRYHDALLSHGSPSMRHIATLLRATTAARTNPVASPAGVK